MQQIRKHDTLLITLTLGIMLILIVGSIMKINNSMIPHTIFHTIGLTLTIFLTIISITAYKRVRSSRFALLTLGFIGFVIMEGINLASTFLHLELNILNIELPHIFGVYVLVLLVLATLRGGK